MTTTNEPAGIDLDRDTALKLAEQAGFVNFAGFIMPPRQNGHITSETLALIDLARRASAPVADERALSAIARDWPEDAGHENGNYQCICSTCGNTFFGYKRRITCKGCATLAKQSPAPVVAHDAPEVRASQPEGATGTTGSTVIWPSEKFVHERIATLMAEIGMPDNTPLWNAFSRFEADLRSRVEAMPAFPATATASIDTMEFQALAGTWCGAAQSCDQWTRTIGAKQAWADLIAYTDARLAAPASAQPDRGAALAEPVQVKIERQRVWIVKGNRSFMLAYVPDEGDDPAEMEAYASNLRSALSIFTPDVKSGVAAPSPASQPVAPEAPDLLDALQKAARLLRAAGFAMTGTATSQIVAAIEAHAQQDAAPACRWPTCLPEAEQDKLADEVMHSLAGEVAVAPSDAKDATVPDHSEREAANAGELPSCQFCGGTKGHWKGCRAPEDANVGDLAIELQGVREEMAAGSGFWSSCSGCYDTEDGHPTGNYSYSAVFGCALGSGCSECGGIGAVWDNTDYEAMAKDWDKADPSPATIAAGQEAANAKDAEPGADHLTPENIAALIADMKACEEGSEVPSIFDRDWRTQCGVIWRVMEHLACCKPAFPQAARDVLAERRRQVEVEGWTPEHDDKYTACELARAAATYATCSHIEQLKLCGEQVWPWHPDWWKRGDYRRDLVKSGALILAEIERVDRDRAAMSAVGAAGQEGGNHG